MNGYAVDLSNYTTNVPVDLAIRNDKGVPVGGRITDKLVQGWLEAGFTRAQIGTQWPHVAAHQLEVCHRNGMELEAYSWLNWGTDIPGYLEERFQLLQPYNILTHWADAEQATNGRSIASVVNDVGVGLETIAKAHEPGVYTGAWWWPANTGNCQDFRQRKLWTANYVYSEGRAPDPITDVQRLGSWTPYGGWPEPFMRQYAGSVATMGANLDLSVYEKKDNDDMLTRHNAIAAGFQPFELNGSCQVQLSQFSPAPPAGIRLVRIEVFLFGGRLEVDDETGSYAGQAGWGGTDADPPQQFDVLVREGYFTLKSLEGPCSIANLGMVGYIA